MESTISGYGLRCPTEDQAFEQLRRVLGPDAAEEAWMKACAAARVASAPRPLSLEQLAAVARKLEDGGGLAGVLGISLRVRVETYNFLAASGAGQP